jgi:hypothetical protein
MKVKFNTDCEIEVISSYDEALDDVEGSTEIIRAGSKLDFDVIGHPERFQAGKGFVEDKTLVNVQFPDGSVAFGISTEWFDETNSDEVPWYNVPGGPIPDNITDKEWDALVNPTKR